MQVEEAALRRTVSKNIAAYRKAHKDTQMDLAAKLNYSDKCISKWERARFHMFILILSIALTFAVATLIFFLFVVFAIPYRAWLFFIYAIPVASILAIVFTSLWWGLLWQGISTSLLVWSLGLSLYLSLPVPNLELIFLVCAAAQVLVILWELFRRSLAKK